MAYPEYDALEQERKALYAEHELISKRSTQLSIRIKQNLDNLQRKQREFQSKSSTTAIYQELQEKIYPGCRTELPTKASTTQEA